MPAWKFVPVLIFVDFFDSDDEDFDEETFETVPVENPVDAVAKPANAPCDSCDSWLLLAPKWEPSTLKP